jgi:hypothetical protein
MTTKEHTMTYDASKLVRAYIKMRDAKTKIMRDADEKAADIQEQMDTVERELLEICKQTGQDGGKTEFGSFTRSVKTRYESTNWARMYEFIRTHDVPELLEQRVHQTNMKQFLQDHPNLMPEGMNVNSRYAVTVRRVSK